VKNKIRAALATAICAGALVAIPATSVAATPHGSPYGTCTGAYSTYSTCKNVKPKLYDTHATDWWKGRFTFGFSLERGSSLAWGTKSFKVTLPHGITWDKRTYARDVSVSDKHTLRLENKDTLLVSLKSTDDKVTFDARSGATIVDRDAMKARDITVRIDATNYRDKTYDLSFSAKAPKPKHHHHHH
jgi:uncharacterized ubiquitin-like protein YukD